MSILTQQLSRRSVMRGMTALAGAAAAPSLLSGFRPVQAAYRTTNPNLPPTFGDGRSVAVLGAGVAGLTAAYTLAKAGFRVAVFEADDRYGGRSLTARPSDERYREWWFDRYPQARAFPRMYADRYRERPESPAPNLQVCRFMDEPWRDGGYRGSPVELFLNAGPGRIPSNHVNLIALCQEIGVALEPYIFQSMSNLMQSQAYNGGRPAPMGQITYSLYGEMAHMMAKVVQEACRLSGDPKSDPRQLANLYELFGGLKRVDPNDPCVLVLDEMNRRLGFTDLPGGWRDSGQTRSTVALKDILNSGFVGDAGENPELSPGSFLFNSFNIDWQPSLMQPVGGMDRIWQQLLVQDIPETAMMYPRDRHGRQAKVGDLVFLSQPATRIAVGRDDVVVTVLEQDSGTVRVERSESFDFCVSTMAPSLLRGVLRPDHLPPAFLAGLEAFSVTGEWDGTLPDGTAYTDPTPDLWTPAIKVGWQSRSRFWETRDEIYGGISWIDDIIGQIWYPSEDFTARTGVLTGAYNRGTLAAQYATQSNGQRLVTAIEGLGKLHPGDEDQIYFDWGLSIAWQYMPHQVGGWASDTALETPDVYRQITTFAPDSRFYCAGDTWSYWPGWQEGSVASAYCAITAIARTIDPDNPAYATSACYGTGG